MRRRTWRSALLLVVLSLASAVRPAKAQGCSQCSEAVGQTPAATQAAYRKGIVVLVLAGGGVFGAALLMLRRFR